MGLLWMDAWLLLAFALEERTAKERHRGRTGNVHLCPDQMQFGRWVCGPMTTSVAIKKSSTNHVHQTFQMSGLK